MGNQPTIPVLYFQCVDPALTFSFSTLSSMLFSHFDLLPKKLTDSKMNTQSVLSVVSCLTITPTQREIRIGLAHY